MMPRSFTFSGSGNEVASRVTAALLGAKFRVVQSFDLASARANHVDCSCPHHGTDLCDCQMIVLLVYGSAGRPVTLTIHGRDGLVRLAVVTDPAQRPVIGLEASIINILSSTFPYSAHPRMNK